MKTIFKSEEITVLSTKDLRYRTDFTPDAIVPKVSTHYPIFYHHCDQHWFVRMGEDVREIRFHKSTFGFRYYDEEGRLSPYWTAIFCQMEGEEDECVILARFYQNDACDYFDRLSPYDDVPSGRWQFESSCPSVFFSKSYQYPNLSGSSKPELYKVELIKYGCENGAEEFTFDYTKYDGRSYRECQVAVPLQEENPGK